MPRRQPQVSPEIIGTLLVLIADGAASIAIIIGLGELNLPWPLVVGVGYLAFALSRLRVALTNK